MRQLRWGRLIKEMVGGDGLEGGAAVCCINSLAVIDRADSGGMGVEGA